MRSLAGDWPFLRYLAAATVSRGGLWSASLLVAVVTPFMFAVNDPDLLEGDMFVIQGFAAAIMTAILLTPWMQIGRGPLEQVRRAGLSGRRGVVIMLVYGLVMMGLSPMTLAMAGLLASGQVTSESPVQVLLGPILLAGCISAMVVNVPGSSAPFARRFGFGVVVAAIWLVIAFLTIGFGGGVMLALLGVLAIGLVVSAPLVERWCRRG